MARFTGSPFLAALVLFAGGVITISLAFILGQRVGHRQQTVSDDEIVDMRRSIDEFAAKIGELQEVILSDRANPGRPDPRTEPNDQASTTQDLQDRSGPSAELEAISGLIEVVESLAREVERLREGILSSSPVPLGPVVTGGVQIGENIEAIRQRLGDPGIKQDQNGSLFLEYPELGVRFHFNPNLQVIRADDITVRADE